MIFWHGVLLTELRQNIVMLPKKQNEYILYELTDISQFTADEKVPENLKCKII